ncbi:MAG TPA: hypothetical protein VFM96_05390 [Gaiellaceae bacterium]|nr:hypothetical protein [Gaiellaceae bacterium]
MIAVAAVTVAIAGTSAAGVLAFGSGGAGPLDRTLSCPAPQNRLDVLAGVRGPSKFVYQAGSPDPNKAVPFHRGWPVHTKLVAHPALVEVDAGRHIILNQGIITLYQTTFAGASPSYKSGYSFDGTVCKQAKTIPFTSAGLKEIGVFTGAQGAGVSAECPIASPATLRMRVTLKSGTPTAATLTLRGGMDLRLAAYVEWTPKRVSVWLAAGCDPYGAPSE